MDRKFVGILGAAVASAVAFIWFQSEDEDELEKDSYQINGDDPKRTKHLVEDTSSSDESVSKISDEEDTEDEEEEEEEEEEDEEEEEEEEQEEEKETKKKRPSKKSNPKKKSN